MLRFEVFILGNSSATPMFDRHPTAQILNYNEKLQLIDCGEGTQMRLATYGIKVNRIENIFISHLHGDHYLGLVGLLSSMNLMGRKSDLHIYGPKELEEILHVNFKHSQSLIQFPLHFHPTNPHKQELLFESKSLKVYSFPLVHRIDCTGFRFDELPRPARLRVELAEAHGIPPAYYARLKNGLDYQDEKGRVYRSSDYTEPAAAVRSYAYCSDTMPDPIYLPSIQGVDLLYHESTFGQEFVQRAMETRHSTARQAAEVAQRVGAKKLLLGHYSARYRDLNPLLQEAQELFPSTELSVEGKWFFI